jgi:hypothetical protein
MGDVVDQLESYVFSSSDIASMTDWPPNLVDDYLSSNRNTITIASELDDTNGNINSNTANIAINAANITINADNITTNTGNITTNVIDIANVLAIVNTQYQCFKLGTQVTTAIYADITGWVEDRNVGGFILNSGNGTIEFTISGEYEISAWVLSDNTSGAGTELDIKFQIDDGGGFVEVQAGEDRQYSARSSSIDAGSAQINNYQITIFANDLIRVQVKHVGNSGDILTDFSRINIRRIA